ncbi:VTT domain-containing protein [Candidatus Woesearchaeota archaeon]|nr:VTT domain-containing protein [Candidatus Woesearchaeota archaeon]
MAKKSFYKDAFIGVLVILGVYLIGILIWNWWGQQLVSLPVIKSLYRLTLIEVERKSVIGLSIISFIGGLFFIGYPGEIIFFLYGRAEYSLFYISAITLTYSMLAQLLNYWFGQLLDKKIIDRFVKDGEGHYHLSLKTYGELFIVIFNILPLPSDILTTFLGMIRYDLKKSMLYTALGRIIKLIFMSAIILMSRGNWFFL